jgi:hypothetical protein
MGPKKRNNPDLAFSTHIFHPKKESRKLLKTKLAKN